MVKTFFGLSRTELATLLMPDAPQTGSPRENRDKVRQALSEGNFSEKQLRLLAYDFAERMLTFVDEPDKRWLDAIAVIRRHATGDATDDELQAARVAAQAANNKSAGDDDGGWPGTIAVSNAAHPIAFVAARDSAAIACFDYTECQWQLERIEEVKLG
jgi:hypothetical protein